MDRKRDPQREPAPVDIGDLAVERHACGGGEKIGRDQPWQVVHVAEIAPDGRQRARQDGVVEGTHEQRQQHAPHDLPRFAMGEGFGLALIGAGVHRCSC